MYATDTFQTPTTKIRIFSCGGAGTNIGLKFAAPAGVDVCFLDTSKANLTEQVDASRVHVLENLDGSGKNRELNYGPISKEIDTILSRFEPADFNIVLYSGAGGSGSTLGPLLHRALLREDVPVVSVVIGTADSKITLKNTIGTIKSLEMISSILKKPVVFAYDENHLSRREVDEEILWRLNMLCELASQRNHEMDTQDVVNFLQYQNVTPLHPQVSLLSIADNRKAALTISEPIAIASLYNDPDEDIPLGESHYRTTGYPNMPMAVAEQLHFVINFVGVQEIVDNLTESQRTMETNLSRYQTRRAAVSVDDEMTDEGLVF